MDLEPRVKNRHPNFNFIDEFTKLLIKECKVPSDDKSKALKSKKELPFNKAFLNDLPFGTSLYVHTLQKTGL